MRGFHRHADMMRHYRQFLPGFAGRAEDGHTPCRDVIAENYIRDYAHTAMPSPLPMMPRLPSCHYAHCAVKAENTALGSHAHRLRTQLVSESICC